MARIEHIDVSVGTGITMSVGDSYVKPSVSISQRMVLDKGDDPATVRKVFEEEISKEVWALFDVELVKHLEKMEDIYNNKLRKY